MSSRFFDLLHTSYFGGLKEEPFRSSSPFDEESGFYFHPLVQNVLSCDKILVDKRIDDNSKIILDTFNEALKRVFLPIMETPIDRIEYAKSYSEKDFSMLISGLSRIMEIELNLSVVQWVRQCEGIEMPQYYNKVKPSASSMPVTSKEITINNPIGSEGKLETQTLGNIQYLMIKYQEKFPKKIQTIAPDFLKVYKLLRKERNNASHTSINGEAEFVEFYNHFCLIIKSGWLKTLMDVKEDLRGW